MGEEPASAVHLRSDELDHLLELDGAEFGHDGRGRWIILSNAWHWRALAYIYRVPRASLGEVPVRALTPSARGRSRLLVDGQHAECGIKGRRWQRSPEVKKANVD